GRGANLSGTSGYWVGHSSECFAVELISDREPDSVRLPGIHREVTTCWVAHTVTASSLWHLTMRSSFRQGSERRRKLLRAARGLEGRLSDLPAPATVTPCKCNSYKDCVPHQANPTTRIILQSPKRQGLTLKFLCTVFLLASVLLYCGLT